MCFVPLLSLIFIGNIVQLLALCSGHRGLFLSVDFVRYFSEICHFIVLLQKLVTQSWHGAPMMA